MPVSNRHMVSTSTKSSNTLPRYAYIDALRGLAIIGVLFAHVSHYSDVVYPAWLQVLTAVDVGPRGVQLFYVVSAFTLCLSLSNRRQNERHPLRNYFLRRFFRIAPLFYIAIIYYLWQQNYWSGNPNHFSPLAIFTAFTFTNGLSEAWINKIVYGGWSIAIETTFYLVFPWLFAKFTSFRTALITTFVVAILMQVLRLFLLALPVIHQTPDLQTYTFEFFPSQLPVFLIGITVFTFMHDQTSSMNKKHLTLAMGSLAFLLVLQELSPLKLIAGHYIYGIIFAVLLYVLSRWPYKILVNRATIFIGQVSFSLYLCHMAVYYWLNQFGLNNYLPHEPYLNFILRFIVLLLSSSIVATGLFFTIEKGGIALAKRIINRHEKVTPTYVSTNARTW